MNIPAAQLKEVLSRTLSRNPFKEKNKIQTELGDILTAKLTSKNGQTALLTTKEGVTIEAPSDSIVGNVGDDLKFLVVKNENDNLTLKQIFDENSKINNQKSKTRTFGSVIELFKKSGIVNEDSVFKSENEDEEAKKAAAVNNIKRKLLYTGETASASAVRELLASGLSLSKISLSALNTVMHEIEKKPFKIMSSEKMSYEKASKKSNNIAKGNEISNALRESGLPISDGNIKTLKKVLDKLEHGRSIEDKVALLLISSNKDITPGNIYIGRYSYKETPVPNPLNNGQWESLLIETKKVFEREKIEESEENLSTAKLFIEHNIPVTKENIDKYNFIKNLHNADKATILSGAAESIRHQEPPENINLLELFKTDSSEDKKQLMEKYEGIIKKLPNITGYTTEMLVRRQLPLTLQNLVDHNDNINNDETDNKEHSALGENVSVKIVNARRQLAEITLKLTYEAAYRLAGKKLDITTIPLHDALNRITEVENEKYSGNLKIMSAQVTEENITGIRSLYDGLSRIYPLAGNVYGDIINNRIKFSISGISSRTTDIDRLHRDYEIFGTAPNPKYGDSFNKVKDGLGEVLVNLGIDPSAGNIKAASILSRNEIDISIDNIRKINEIDVKLNSVCNRLHPNIAASMIKDGFNPIDAHIDEVLEYIDSFNDVYGNNLDEKMSEYILEMDKNKELSISQEDRKSIIAFYRMLNNIRSDDAAAIGVTLKHGSELTMGNLLEASHSYTRAKKGKTNVDVSINKSFGGLDAITAGANIRKSLESAYNREAENLEKEIIKSKNETEAFMDQNNMGHTSENIKRLRSLINEGIGFGTQSLSELSHNMELISTLAELANPEVMAKLFSTENSKTQEELLNTPLRELLYEIEEMNTGSTEYEISKYMDLLQDMAKTPANAIHWMEKNELPLTLNNMLLMNEFTKNQFFISDKINKLDDDLKEQLLDELPLINVEAESFLEGITNYDDISREISQKLEDIKSSLDEPKQAEAVDIIRKAVNFQSNMSGIADRFGMLTKNNGKISGLNIYFLNESRETGENILMALKTDGSGSVFCDIKINGDNVSVNINASESDTMEALKDGRDRLEDMLNEAGVSNPKISYTKNEPATASLEKSDKIHNKQIFFYRVVSAVAKYVTH